MGGGGPEGERASEAEAALEEALTAFRARDEREAAARALILLASVRFGMAGVALVALAAEAVDLLEHEPPGATLVAAYAQLAGAHFLDGKYGEAIVAADQALALAQTLDLPEPARALGVRGNARAHLGDPDGLAEMERALAELVEQGAGREAASLQNNLAMARYPLDGPARSLVAFEQDIVFCERRGLSGLAANLEVECLGRLAELGRPEQALERAGPVAAVLEARGEKYGLIWVRALELSTHLARGQFEDASGIADWLVEATPTRATPDTVVEALAAAAAARLVAGTPDQARAFLAEVEQTPGARNTPYYARHLTAMVRTALAAGEPALARQLTEGVESRYPLDEHALCASRAQLAEHAGDHAEAATLYAQAAAGWQGFGTSPSAPTRSSARAAA